MTTYVLRRSVAAVTLLWIVVTFVFFAIYGNPSLIILGGLESRPSAEPVVAVQHELRLDQPIVERYVEWLAQMFHAPESDAGTGCSGDGTRGVRRVAGRDPRDAATRDGDRSVRHRGCAARVFGPRVRHWSCTGRGVLAHVGLITVGRLHSVDRIPRPVFFQYLILPVCTLAAAPLAMTMGMTRSTVLEQLSLRTHGSRLYTLKFARLTPEQ